MKFNKRTIYIVLFALLYISVALVSTIHAVAFFGLANAYALGIMLAITFEIGQAAVLFSILTSKQDRSKFMPWCLMGILTLVQIMGNVFSSYKYLISNSVDQLRYFKEPIFVWTELPDAQCNVILTYIIGAILPIVALCMTSMLTNYLEDTDESEQSNIDSETLELPNNIKPIETKPEIIKEEQTIEPHVENEIEKNVEEKIDNIVNNIEQDNEIEKNTTFESTKPEKTIEEKQVDEILTKPSSHFINL